MQNYKQDIQTYLDDDPRYRACLFKRGYLITDAALPDLRGYPFYGQWRALPVGQYQFLVHNDQNIYVQNGGDVTAVMIGHGYNPFTMQHDENVLLAECLEALRISETAFFEKVSEFTGIHLICMIDHLQGQTTILQDCAGMQSCYFGTIGGHIYITEYPQLVGDMLGLEPDPFVEKPVATKCYNIGNRYLPGNRSPFRELKRLGGNTCLRYTDSAFAIRRFYPAKPHPEYGPEEFAEGVAQIYKIIHNGISLCTKKWERRAISLTGGTDSKTTLACTAGLYDQFHYFSFVSKPSEQKDAEAARKICGRLGLEHTLYKIPEQNEEIADFLFWKKLIAHNTNYIKNLSDSEIRKYVYLYQLNAYDIELKSWISEVGRAFMERRYKLIKLPERLTERHLSIFQTRYFMHPLLLRESDRIYKAFMREIGLETGLFNFAHSDLFYWEIRMGAWGTAVTSSQNLYHLTTMPMNNRKLMEIFLSFPHDMRKADKVHTAVMEYANQAVTEEDITVRNKYFTGKRMWLETIYYLYRTLFYRKRK